MSDLFLDKHFAKFQSNLELKDTHQQLVEQKHLAIRAYIENNADKKIETKLIGALQRRTKIHPRPGDQFDIDVLVVLGTFSTRSPLGLSPQNAMDELARLVRSSDRYASLNPVQDDPTVTVNYAGNSIRTELVPAYRDNIGISLDGTKSYQLGRAYWVAKHGIWEIADYDYEAEFLSEMNKGVDKKLIPFIKVLKALKRNLFDYEGFDSVHLEILACNILPSIIARRKTSSLLINIPLLLLDFLSACQSQVGGPLNFLGSHFPDRYIMEPAKSHLVRGIPIVIQHIMSLLDPNLTQEVRVNGWIQVFGDVFPKEVV